MMGQDWPAKRHAENLRKRCERTKRKEKELLPKKSDSDVKARWGQLAPHYSDLGRLNRYQTISNNHITN
jgi:hypothetical protein